MADDLTEEELGTLSLALAKCQLINSSVKSGKFKLCIIPKEYVPKAAQQGFITMILPFGFPDMTDDQTLDLMEKLDDMQKCAWLKEQKK